MIGSSNMASKSMWGFIGSLGGASSSTVPAVADFLHLSRINVERIILLTSHESRKTLNPAQCRSVSSKLQKTLESIDGMLRSLDGDKSFLNAALENFYLVSDRAKELVESCSNVDWCQTSTFQIQNEEAFKQISLETGLCYGVIFELVQDRAAVYNENRCFSSAFEPPSSDEISEVKRDQEGLIERFRLFVSDGEPFNQNQQLAKYLLRRLVCFTSQSSAEDFDLRTLNMSDCLGRQIERLLGNNVTKRRFLGVPCAVKEFENYEYDEEGAEALILREARIMALLNHPNVVKFICCGHDIENSRDFIAMEFMEQGLHSVIGKLRQVKHRKGAFSPFPLLSAVDIMMQIAYGVCCLHDIGVAHRDIKSSNVVVRQITTPHLQDYLQVKLVDFGLSKSKIRASKSNTISHPKTGTAVYMAPEAFNEGRANWLRADVYSFGVLCSVILSGEEPFPLKEIERSRLYEAIRSGRRPMIPSETPPELTALIQECWNGDRNRRPDFLGICSRLATLRYKLLRGGDSHGDSFQPLVYIQDMMRKRSDARQSVLPYRLRENPADEEEVSSVQNQTSAGSPRIISTDAKARYPAPEAKRLKGVRFRPDHNRWVAEMKPPKSMNKVSFGEFHSQIDAARVVDVAFHHYGRPLNFPDSTPDLLSSKPSSAGLSAEATLEVVRNQTEWMKSMVSSQPYVTPSLFH